MQQACSSVGFDVALFEVLQDIDDPKQYNLLRKLSNISDILLSWRTRLLKYVKVVIPVYPRAINTDRAAKTILKSIPSPNTIPENDKTRSSATAPTESIPQHLISLNSHRVRGNSSDETTGSLLNALEVL